MDIFLSSIYWEHILRLVIAGILGLAIGVEREYRAKEAGYRTHFLVCVGSALLMLVSQFGFEEVLDGAAGDKVRLDPARVAAQVVSGIGFIGAGTILLRKQVVRGLTTAAGIWAASGVGLAVGSGMYATAIVATVLILIGLEFLSKLFKGLGLRSLAIEILFKDKAVADELYSYIIGGSYRIVSYELESNSDGFSVSMVIKYFKKGDDLRLFKKLQSIGNVTIKKLE